MKTTYLIFLTILLFCFKPNNNSAPDFKMTTADGKEIQLSDYQGQVVYISFWASWCGVCIRNFNTYRSTRKQLAEKGVLLLNISMDKSDKDWHKSMSHQDIAGVHAMVNDYDKVQEMYEIYSLPAYEILDKSGNLVYLSDGENRDIFQDFDVWLTQ